MYGFDTKAIHASSSDDHPTTDVTPPIHVTSSYAFKDAETAQRAFRGEIDEFVYGRVHNPTQHLLEWRLKELEGAEAAVVLSSGIAAISSLFLSLVEPGDEVIAHHCLYGNTFRFFRDTLRHHSAQVRFVDLTNPQNLASQLTDRTKFVFLETPTNPFLEIIDIGEISRIAHSRGAQCIVDSTLASPALLRPLQYGANAVIHSLSKYIGGHGDLIGGAVIGTTDIVNRVRKRGLRYATGAALSPFHAYLALRGLKTLGLRMSRHSASALELAQQLLSHPNVEEVFYPTLPQTSTAKVLADKYMPSGGGGVFSFRIAGSHDAPSKFLNGLVLPKIAVSLGTCETLVQHPASMTHAAYSENVIDLPAVPHNLIRVAVGLEDPGDLMADFCSAFQGL